MQKIKYETSGGTIILSDVDTGSVNGEWCRLWLNDFDGNSLALGADTVECIGVPGQRTLSATPKARTITLKTGFAPLYRENGLIVHRGEPGKHELRREVLHCFPLGEKGRLTYCNDVGEWSIDAYVSETPKISYPAGTWAEAAVYLTADYPYWELPPETSETITVSAGETGFISSQTWGDIESPIELYVEVLEDVVPDRDFTLKCQRYIGAEPERRKQFFSFKPLSAGTLLKYCMGVDGVTMVYVRSGDRWDAAPQYLYFTGAEHSVRTRTEPTTFGISLPDTSGSIRASMVFHRLVTAI